MLDKTRNRQVKLREMVLEVGRRDSNRLHGPSFSFVYFLKRLGPFAFFAFHFLLYVFNLFSFLLPLSSLPF